MRRMLIALGLVGVLLVPTAAYAGETSSETVGSDQTAGPAIGGNYGTSGCYVEVDYFRIDIGIQPTRPYVDVETEGSIGGGVHCPLDELLDLIAIDWGP
jgi:hypothetical protein